MQDALGPLPKVLELKIAQDWRKLKAEYQAMIIDWDK